MSLKTDLCIVLGNGPSLRGIDFKRFEGVDTVGMNAAYRYWDEINWYPTHYVCLDDQLIKTHHKEIHRLFQTGKIKSFFLEGSFFDIYPDLVDHPSFHTLDQFIPYWFGRRGKEKGWTDLTDQLSFQSDEIAKITTGSHAVRFCAFKGYKKVALLGIDLKYVEILPEAEATEGVGLVMTKTPESNPNYFFDSYQQKGDLYNIPNPSAHNQDLHPAAFRVMQKDFVKRSIGIDVVNANRESLLYAEGIFPFEELYSVLGECALGGVVVPSTKHEIKAIVTNFEIWSRPDFQPWCSRYAGQRVPLVIYFNNRAAEPFETEIRAAYDRHGMERFFTGLTIDYLGLEGDADRYERDYTKEVGATGYKAGPNNQFFSLMRRSAMLGHYVFQMETDCVPLRRGWLSQALEMASGLEPFWVMGSPYFGAGGLDKEYRKHINGNALYAPGDPRFQNFIEDFWEKRTWDLVANVDKRLAYDCILDFLFSEYIQSDQEVWDVWRKNAKKFRHTDYILNISGNADLGEFSEQDMQVLRKDFPDAYVLHNRKAQEFVAGTKNLRPTPERSPHMASRMHRGAGRVADTVELPVGKALEPQAGSERPRLLVIDMTPMGSGSATGQVKSSLLQDWQAGEILQLASPGHDRYSLVRRNEAGGYDSQEQSLEQIRSQIDAFDPEVILYRPLADRPGLHDFAMAQIAQRDVPLVTWIMDDWPARLQAEDPARFATLDQDLRTLLQQSALRLSICDAMSEAFEARYGVSFKAYANGIDPQAWRPQSRAEDGVFLLRYAGGLAPDMNAQSIQRVAQAVQELADDGAKIRMEINTQPWWLEQSGALFDGLSAVSLSAESRSAQDYAKWSCSADALLIAYNFDDTSMRYVRYSMANKLPECLASGAALLVHGSKEVATVGYVAKAGVAELVDSPSKPALRQALQALLKPEHRQRLGAAGRELALARHDLQKISANLTRDIMATCRHMPGFWAAQLDPTGALQALPDLQLPQDRDGQVLIVYDQVEDVLAQALARQQDWEATLADWQEQAQSAISAFYQARDRVKLLPRLSWLGASAGGFEERFGLNAQQVLPLQGPGRDDLVMHALACQILREHPHVLQAQEQLQACSHMAPAVEADRPASDQLITAAATVLQQRQKAQQLSQVQRQAQKQLNQVQSQTQQKLDQWQQRSTTESDAQKLLQEQLKQLQAVSEQYFSQLSERSEEVAQLRQALQKTEQERDARAADLHRTQEELGHARGEIDHIYGSKSWRVTEPMRQARRMLSSAKTVEHQDD